MVSTKAASLQEAIQDVEEQYHNSEIILDAEDLKETTIEAAHPQLDEEITTDLRGIFCDVKSSVTESRPNVTESVTCEIGG